MCEEQTKPPLENLPGPLTMSKDARHDESPLSLPDLPEDVFLFILDGLEPWEVVCCQMVSRTWRKAFSKEEYLQIVLKKYVHAKEVRELEQYRQQTRPSNASLTQVDWSGIFNTVAARYYHLQHGKARTVEKHKLAASDQIGHFFPVGQWDYHESQPGGRLYYENATHLSQMSRVGAKPYLFRFNVWSYDDGLLIFAPADRPPSSKPGEILALLDIATGEMVPIPFDISSKVIRNLRLRDGALIIEWAEKDPFHDLNDMEQVNRHFATCFDIHPSCSGIGWTISHRSEWKMHFLGLPLNHRDRFFSTHNSHHYAVYFWQPNRSMYTGDEELPIESLFVWDISQASPYLPSTDPSGKSRPRDDMSSHGPHIVARLPFNELDALGIRQHSNISLMSLQLCTPSLSLTVRENTCVAGQGYFDPAERLWCARTTTFPFVGAGPALRREWDGNLPPYRGHCSMESSDVQDSEGWFVPVMDVIDRLASVRLSLVETCFTGQMMENRTVIRVSSIASASTATTTHDDDDEDDNNNNDDDDDNNNNEQLYKTVVATLDDAIVRQVAAMGRIAGDERWIVGQNDTAELVVARF